MRSPYQDPSSNIFFKLFPPPSFLRMPSVGIDISDHSIRFVDFGRGQRGLRLSRFGHKAIPEGILSYGDIKDRGVLKSIISTFAREEHLNFVRASLPEEKAYLFKTTVPVLSAAETRENIDFQIEENVPLKAAETVFDYVFLPGGQDASTRTRDVVVSVFPEKVVRDYLELYQSAGLTPLSFEMEAHAIARAVVRDNDPKTYMIVDFGQQRTGLSIVSNGEVQFTSTVEVGGNILTAAIQKHFSISWEEAEKKKCAGTFTRHGEHAELFSTLMNSVSALKDEINKHYLYWHSHPDKRGVLPHRIEKIILCGGDANLAGLPEHLSLAMRTEVQLGDVWVNAFSLDRYVPPIPFASSLSYAAAIGLALRTSD